MLLRFLSRFSGLSLPHELSATLPKVRQKLSCPHPDVLKKVCLESVIRL
jgi:hypothetical protein